MDIENLENKEENTMDDIENLENEDSKYVENNKFIEELITNTVNDLKIKVNKLEDEREKIKEILNIKSDDIIENLNNNSSVFF